MLRKNRLLLTQQVGATIAQWIRLRFLTYRPGFYSQHIIYVFKMAF